ncbi:MAG: deoxyribose-phosphate aldolase [Bacteroidales bacterium]|nr:deoxyribose-phosphate aldolase [Bacteroidales bacterium]MCF8456988.1 deoxyribose-phosphate aldolase [Bacteroidales bacterium]
MKSIYDTVLSFPKLAGLLTKYPPLEHFTNSNLVDMSSGDLKKVFSLIDLTTLDVADTNEKVVVLCEKANTLNNKYPGIPNVAAICVYPNFVSLVKEKLTVPGVQIASVVGGFPASQTFLEIKTMEAKMAIGAGATEADMVISVGKLLEGNYEEVHNEIVAIKKALGTAHLKVILETGALDQEQIYTASLIAMEAGADFIKTSTGKISPAATPEAMIVMCLAIREFQKKYDKKIGIKPAGGISTPEEAMVYYRIVREILGEDWLNNTLFRIGASRLASNLLENICALEGIAFVGY